MREPSAARATILVSGAALISRILGLLRDVLVAAALGAGPVADAFLIAWRIPNLARRALAEGAVAAGFAPAYGRVRDADGDDAAARLAGEAFVAVGLVLAGVVAVAMLAAAGVVALVAPGAAGEATGALAADLTRLTLPAIVAFGLSGLLSAILAARHRVGALSLAPLATNATLIAVLLVAPARIADPEHLAFVLAAGVTASALVQLAIVALALRGASAIRFAGGLRIWRALRETLGPLLPAIVSVAAVELIFLAATQVASFTPGAVARLYYAERLIQLPLGLVAAAATAVLLPAIAARHRAGGDGLAQATNAALVPALVLALPAATGLALLAEPIVTVVFARGAFGAEDVAETAAILVGLSIGLPLAAAGKILQQGAFARERNRPGLIALAAGLATTLLAGPPLVAALGALGLGLAVSAGLGAHTVVLSLIARVTGTWRADVALGRRVAASAVACGAMAGWLVWLDAGADTPGLALAIGSGGVVYAGVAVVLGAIRTADLRR